MFKEPHNTTINLMINTSLKLRRAYDEIIHYIPKTIKEKCKKGEEFEKEIDDVIYSLESLKNGEKWEFKTEDLNTESIFNIQFKEFSNEELENIEKNKPNITYKLGKITIEMNSTETTYTFELNKNDDNEYIINMKKYVVTTFDDILEREKERKLTPEELTQLLKQKSTNR